MRSCKAAVIAAVWLCTSPVLTFAQGQAIAPARPVPPAVLSVIAPDGRYHRIQARVFVDGEPFCDDSTDRSDTQICEGAMTAGAHLVRVIYQRDNEREVTVNGNILLLPGDWVEHDPSQAKDFKYWCIAVGESNLGEMSKYDRDCHAS